MNETLRLYYIVYIYTQLYTLILYSQSPHLHIVPAHIENCTWTLTLYHVFYFVSCHIVCLPVIDLLFTCCLPVVLHRMCTVWVGT